MKTRGPVASVASVAAVLAVLVYAVALGVLHVFPRYDCIVLSLVLVAVFRVLDGESERGRTLALHLTSQFLLAAFLVHLWTVGYEGRNAVFGGIVPWSDSHDFHEDALRLAYGERFTEVSSKRPLFSTVLAAMLRATGSLRVSLALLALVGAWAMTQAALAVWRTHGFRSALVVYVILLFFERRWTGFVQTEHLGFPLGAIGFRLVWGAAHGAETPCARPERSVLAGLGAMSLGLMARAGAFFVLPALVVWWARRSRRRLRFVLLAVLAVGLGFSTHKAVLSATGRGVTFSDYPGIFYGLMHGEDYTHLVLTHPALGALPVAERVPEAWRIVMDEAKARPSLVASGFAASGAGLFTSPFGMFSYVWTNPDDHVLEDGAVVRAATARDGPLGPLLLWRRTLGTYSLLNAGAMGLIGGSFVIAVAISIVIAFTKRRRDPELSLLRHAIAGVVLSAPFTPPWITSGQQVQTVTLAFVAALPAVVLFARAKRQRTPSALPPREPLVFAPAVVVLAFGVIVAWLRLAPLARPIAECGARSVVRVFPDLVVDVARGRSLVFREKAESDLRTSIGFLAKHNRELTDSITPFVKPGTRYALVFDACVARTSLLVDDGALLPPSASWVNVEAPPLASPIVRRVGSATVQAPVEP